MLWCSYAIFSFWDSSASRLAGLCELLKVTAVSLVKWCWCVQKRTLALCVLRLVFMCQSYFLFCKTPQHKACGHEGTILCSLLLLLLRELLSHRAGTGEKVLVWDAHCYVCVCLCMSVCMSMCMYATCLCGWMHGSEEGPGGRLNETGIVTANDEGTGSLKDHWGRLYV